MYEWTAPRIVFRCCTAIRRTVSLSSFRDIAWHIGIIDDSSVMKLFILSRLRFSISEWFALLRHHNFVSPHSIKIIQTYSHFLLSSVVRIDLASSSSRSLASLQQWEQSLEFLIASLASLVGILEIRIVFSPRNLNLASDFLATPSRASLQQHSSKSYNPFPRSIFHFLWYHKVVKLSEEIAWK